MRHRVATKSFNRDTKARAALLKGLVRSLIEHGTIETTLAKAKVVKRLTDKILSKATVDSLTNRRIIHVFFGKRDVVNTIFQSVMPAVAGRTSGFTRIERIGNRRGDNTEIVKISLVSQPENTGTLKNTNRAAKEKAPKKVSAKKKVTKEA